MILGITGGIATGKSTVSSLLQAIAEERGRPVAALSADAIARDLLDPGTPATLAVIEKFGQSVTIDEEPDVLDRRALGSLIFSDDSSRRWLENLLHPRIVEQLTESSTPFKGRRAEGRDGKSVLLMEIPLLFEANLEYLVDRVLVTTCPESLQLTRIMLRRQGTSETEAQRQINAQLPQETKIAKADFVIETGKPVEAVRRELGDVLDAVNSWRV